MLFNLFSTSGAAQHCLRSPSKTTVVGDSGDPNNSRDSHQHRMLILDAYRRLASYLGESVDVSLLLVTSLAIHLGFTYFVRLCEQLPSNA